MLDRTQSAAFMIRRVSRTFKRRLDQNPDRLPLTHAQAGVMFFVRQAESEGRAVSPSDVESALHLTRPTVTGLLQRLEGRGFLTTTPDPQDKRFKRLHTTPAFQAHHQIMEAYLKNQEQLLLEGFTPQEEAQLLSYLNRMLHNLEEGGGSYA
ncbi:MAG: MarR family transcriptional regulator [Clostridia bacterium]|nr:MarR family transcriptional regulator [Clostridia bacterium]